MDDQGPHFLDTPEIQRVFTDVLQVIVAESDRGAVLVGLAVVEEYLKGMFERRLPPDMQSSEIKGRIFGPTGPLGGVSSRADVARAVGWLAESVHKSIHRLRKLRNKVAHSPESFRLSEHRQAILEMLEMSEGLRGLIQHTASIASVANVVFAVQDKYIEELDGTKSPMFSGWQDVLDKLQDHGEAVKAVERNARRMEIGLLVGFICACIVGRSKEAA
jgi:hypothetical protein